MSLALNIVDAAQTTQLATFGNGQFFPPAVKGYGVLSHNEDQFFSAANTAEMLIFDTVDQAILNFAVTDGGIIEIQYTGVYVITVQSQVSNGGGTNRFYGWAQVDSGTGFENVPNSTVLSELSSQSDIAQTIVYSSRLLAGQRVRFMGLVTSTAMHLRHTDAFGPVPGTPATITTVVKLA